MTFIVGMLCNDGLVLCSDSLESDGYSKSHVQKLYEFTPEAEHSRWGIAWGCAGDGPIIKRFNDKLLELLKNEKTAYDRHRLEELLESLVQKMHQDYPNDRLSLVAALWGVRTNAHDLRLYSVKEASNCLSVEDRFACAGMDTSLARFLLDSIFVGKDVTTSDGVHLSAFATCVMKVRVDGVEGPTQLLRHHWSTAKWARAPKGEIATIEKFAFIEKSKVLLDDLEQTIRRFCWSRFPHKYKGIRHNLRVTRKK